MTRAAPLRLSPPTHPTSPDEWHLSPAEACGPSPQERCSSAAKTRTAAAETMASGSAAGRQPGGENKEPGISALAVTFTGGRTGDGGGG